MPSGGVGARGCRKGCLSFWSGWRSEFTGRSPAAGMAQVAQQAQDFSSDRIFRSEKFIGIEILRTLRPLGQSTTHWAGRLGRDLGGAGW
jgi:hypothetical protein